MPRYEKRVTIKTGDPNNRDEGKTYLIKEMDAVSGEKWAMRLLNAAAKSGVSMGEIDPLTGMAGVAGLGPVAAMALVRMPWELAEPLMDEMMTCVKPVSADGSMVRDRLLPDDTEEIATRITLREEVASLHLGFSLAERLRDWTMDFLTKLEQRASSTTPTSPELSEPSPPAAPPRGRTSPRS